MKKIITFIILLIFNFSAKAQEILINEIMSSNSIIEDNDGTFQDWIELYNSSSNGINLEGYGLSDDPLNPYKWVLPRYWIQPGRYLIIWCSDKDRRDIFYPLHSNFKISSQGENITLTMPNGEISDSYPAILIPENYSYGRITDGNSALVFFDQPTHLVTNNTSIGYSEILNPPSFSVNSGFFTESFDLIITHTDPETIIVYTLDGSNPNIDNLNGTIYQYKNQYPYEVGQIPSDIFLNNNFQSFQYAQPLLIVDRTNQPNDISMISTTYDNDCSYYTPENNVFKGTVVRARAYKGGAAKSEIVTQTYFVSPQGSDKFSIPVISLSVDEDKFFDYNEGVYVAGVDFDNWRLENPNTEALWNADANYERSGDETEQIGHFNYFVNGEEVLNQKVGIRLNGGGSRSFQQKSLRLYARSELGASTFNYPIFTNENYNSYKRLILRNSGNDFFNTFYKDAFTHELVEKTGLDNQAYQPSVVFLNGEYWGMLNIRERLDRHYFERKYGIGEEDIEILADEYRVEEGSDTHFQAMFTFLQNNSLEDNANFDFINTQIDVDNFRDYFITNIFIQNTDWPGWNTLFWRKNTPSYLPNASYGNDGRWRTTIKDTDAGFGLMLDRNDHDTLEFATATGGPVWPNPEWSTLILRKLLENERFKTSFINRFADMMNTYFLPERVIALSNQFASIIQPEIPNQIERWSAPLSIDWWEYSRAKLETFATVRPEHQRQHIRAKFDIDGTINATLNVSDYTQGFVKINTVEINSNTPGVETNPYPWSGIYFQDIPVTLKAIPLPGFVFSHWSGVSTSTDSEITITANSDFNITANFVPEVSNEVEVPIYFWFFDNNVTNDAPLVNINSSFELQEEAILQFDSCLDGYPFDNTHPNWRKASMERRNSPTTINYIPETNSNIPFETSNMKGIQIKQPFQNEGKENSLVFNLSTANYKDIKFAFAAKNELAAEGITVEYSTALGSPSWTSVGLAQAAFPLSDEYQLIDVNFSSILEVNNNQNFKIRLRFTGANMTEDLGKRVSFNNFSVKGVLLTLDITDNAKLDFKVIPNPVVDILNVVHQYDLVDYKLLTIDGKLVQSGSLVSPQINVERLQSGIYIAQFTTDGKSIIKKFIKK